jgi:NitT/TauT family transport system ATP-binding protein
MSGRPGRIIDEIEIDLPHRENPIACRQDAKVHDYVLRLMERIDIGEIAHGTR